MWFVVLLYALFASVFTVSKQALTVAEPFFLVGARMFLAGILMLGYQFFRDRSEFCIKKGSLWRILSLAIFNIYLTNVFEFWGMQYLTSGKTCFIYSIAPFASAFLSFLLLGEKLNKTKWFGLLIGFSGLIPILISQTSAEVSSGAFWIFSYAELAVVGATLSSVYGWIVLKQLITEDGYCPIMINGLGMAIGGAFALCHSYAQETWDPLPVRDFMPFMWCTLFLIVVSNCICYNLYGYLLKRFSATFMSFSGLTTPIFAAIFGWLFHGELTSVGFWISFTIIFLGLILFYGEEIDERSALDRKWYLSPQSLVRVLKIRLRGKLSDSRNQ